MTIVVVKLHERYEKDHSYDQYCKDCGKVTRQKYRGTYNQNKEDMFICQECGGENFEEKERQEFLRESHDVTDRFNRLLSKYGDKVDITTEEDVGNDISYFKLVKNVKDAIRFNYHSDYWGDADLYQEEVVGFMSRLAPMIGGVYSDEDGDSYEIVGLLIDKQYNSLGHCKVLIKKVTSDSRSISEDTVKKSNGKWTNRGDDGKEHGEFDTKKQADDQRKAMFANGYKGESLKESTNYKIVTLTMDVAVKPGDQIKGIGGGSDSTLWRDIAEVLRKHGYEMAGDYIDVEEGPTDFYKDNEYEFFD